jgi:hypothetical protein
MPKHDDQRRDAARRMQRFGEGFVDPGTTLARHFPALAGAQMRGTRAQT